MAFTTFQKQLNSFIRYLRLTSNLDARFDDGTPEELQAAGDCLICRYAMQPYSQYFYSPFLLIDIHVWNCCNDVYHTRFHISIYLLCSYPLSISRREHMDRAKKLPCGHLFHLDCLRMWLQHQQTCPLCRSNTSPLLLTDRIDRSDLSIICGIGRTSP